jgi:phosphopantetheinyl transferase
MQYNSDFPNLESDIAIDEQILKEKFLKEIGKHLIVNIVHFEGEVHPNMDYFDYSDEGKAYLEKITSWEYNLSQDFDLDYNHMTAQSEEYQSRNLPF